MTGLEGLGFAAPLALLGLFALPLIWWLSRLTPPKTREQIFPPMALLANLQNQQRQAVQHPLLLLMLRILAFALLILGLSGPVMEQQKMFEGPDPVLIVLEDGFAAGQSWQQQLAILDQALQAAGNRNLPITLVGTAPRQPDGDVLFFENQGASTLRRLVSELQPQAWPGNANAALGKLQQAEWQGQYQALWLEDGLQDQGEEALFSWLSTRALLQVNHVGMPHYAITDVRRQADRLDVTLESVNTGAGTNSGQQAWLRLGGDQGQTLAREAIPDTDGTGLGNQHLVQIALPTELLNKGRRLSVENTDSAAAVFYLDDRHHRKTALIIEDNRSEQPLLRESHYMLNALLPDMQVDIVTPSDASTDRDPGIILLTDQGALRTELQTNLENYIHRGGIVTRFAGPRLAGTEEPWLPIPLRQGLRAVGSTLSWQQPVPLGGFSTDGPFGTIPVPPDIRVQQQVLADPAQMGKAEVWAYLQDGTPLITAKSMGQGWFILVHTGARTDWSNLALSGLFVTLLERMSELSALGPGGDANSHAARDRSDSGAKLPLLRAIDGLGRLSGDMFGQYQLDPMTKTGLSWDLPPGLYGNEGQHIALNAGPEIDRILPVSLPALTGQLPGNGTSIVISLTEPLVIAALVVLFIEMVISAFMMRDGVPAWMQRLAQGRFRQTGEQTRDRRPNTAPAGTRILGLVLLLAGGFSVFVHDAQAETAQVETIAGQTISVIDAPSGDDKIKNAVLETRLAYILTGDDALDAKSHAGLRGLSHVLIRRTSVEPASPVGVYPDSDELRLYPLIYWPVTENTQLPNPVAVDNLRQYTAIGGTLVFDTQDAIGQSVAGNPNARQKLASILRRLDVPALTRIPQDHILTKAFYLLQHFPGRYDNGEVWVEEVGARAFDGVSRYVIGAQDWAGAWAVDKNGIASYAIAAGSARGGPERRREFARRFGVNLVMYVLTGNYKADQVHVPAILERLGQ